MTHQDSARPSLEFLFHPRSIAIAGVSLDLARYSQGRTYLRALINAGFPGRLYPLNPSGAAIFGLPSYPDIKDVPGTVDFVISAIPARFTPQLIAAAAHKGARVVHLFTAGFSELGQAEAARLEAEIVSVARQHQVRLIGPNGMGIYCPASRLVISDVEPIESGDVGFLAQSGGNSMYGIRAGIARGVYFSKVISYGNGADLTETDFLDYLAHDPETRVIALYIEGVKDGRRFFHALQSAARAKPVIILKGGRTEAGSRTTQSHTASLAGRHAVWRAVFRQTGAIEVQNMDELVDMLVLFRFTAPPTGRNMAVVGLSGGASVQAADSISEAGLLIPPLDATVRRTLQQFNPGGAGSIIQNPIDLFPVVELAQVQQAMTAISRWPEIDLLLFHIPIDLTPASDMHIAQPYVQALTSMAAQLNKKTVVALQYVTSESGAHAAAMAQAALVKAGFPVFPSVARAAVALQRYWAWQQRQRTSD